MTATDLTDFQRIERVIHFLESARATQPSLSELADVAGLSPSHFDRLFHRLAGLPPKKFLAFLNWKEARAALRTAPVFEAALSVGLSGAGRLHDLFLKTERMTPGEFKSGGAGLTIRYATFDTALGPALFAATERGLCALHFGDAAEADTLRAEWPKAALSEDARFLEPFRDAFEARLKGSEPKAPLRLLLGGTDFQLQVWEALLRIPEGRTVSYGELASALGRPKAARAVGSAVAENRLGYLIPCHRVIRATGAFDQYRWGPSRKRLLLAVEAARAAH